jgi:hypothetical protein
MLKLALPFIIEFVNLMAQKHLADQPRGLVVSVSDY